MNLFKPSEKQLWIGLVGLYLISRLVNLGILPIFNDEAIYLDWGQRMVRSGDWFMSLFDGKPPLLMWVFGLAVKILSDPLIAGRLVSVIAGLLSLIGITLLAKKYFKAKFAWLPGLIYVLSPLFLFYDRQALMESAVSAISIWSFYCLIRMLNKPSFKWATILGILWTIGLWIKLNFLVFVGLSLMVILVRSFFYRRKISFKKEWGVTVMLPIFAVCLTGIMMLPLLVQKLANQLWLQNGRFAFSVNEIIKFPLSTWMRNFWSVIDIVWWQMGLLVWLLVLLTLGKRAKKPRPNEDWFKWIVVWVGGGIVCYVALVKAANSRYLVSFLPLGLLILTHLVRRTGRVGLVAMVGSLIWFGYLDLLLIFSPLLFFKQLSSVSAYSQINEYTGGFTSGYGVREAAEYVAGQLNERRGIVGIRLDAGNPENSVSLYLSKYPNIQVVYLDSRSVDLPGDKDYLVSDRPIYFISRDRHLAGLDKFLILEREFKKLNQEVVGVYRVKTRGTD